MRNDGGDGDGKDKKSNVRTDAFHNEKGCDIECTGCAVRTIMSTNCSGS